MIEFTLMGILALVAAIWVYSDALKRKTPLKALGWGVMTFIFPFVFFIYLFTRGERRAI